MVDLITNNTHTILETVSELGNVERNLQVLIYAQFETATCNSETLQHHLDRLGIMTERLLEDVIAHFEKKRSPFSQLINKSQGHVYRLLSHELLAKEILVPLEEMSQIIFRMSDENKGMVYLAQAANMLQKAHGEIAHYQNNKEQHIVRLMADKQKTEERLMLLETIYLYPDVA